MFSKAIKYGSPKLETAILLWHTPDEKNNEIWPNLVCMFSFFLEIIKNSKQINFCLEWTQ